MAAFTTLYVSSVVMCRRQSQNMSKCVTHSANQSSAHMASIMNGRTFNLRV